MGGSPCRSSHPAHLELFPGEKKEQAVSLPGRALFCPACGLCLGVLQRPRMYLGEDKLQGHELVSMMSSVASEVFKENLGQSKGWVTKQ